VNIPLNVLRTPMQNPRSLRSCSRAERPHKARHDSSPHRGYSPRCADQPNRSVVTASRRLSARSRRSTRPSTQPNSQRASSAPRNEPFGPHLLASRHLLAWAVLLHVHVQKRAPCAPQNRHQPQPDAETSRRQETDGGQRCLHHSSHVANPAGGSSMGSLPSSSPGVGMSILAAHSASSLSDMGQVVCGASAWR